MVSKKKIPRPSQSFFAINVLFIICLPLILLGTVLFAITYILLHQYLKGKYGKLYGGLLSSGDALWKAEDVSRPIINICSIINADSDSPELLFKTARSLFEKKIENNPEKFSKFTSACRSLFGYGYLLKRHVKVADCITVADTSSIKEKYLTRETLSMIMSHYGNKALPKNNEALWELILVPKAIVWSDDVRTGTQFPIILRCSHVLGDGFTIFSQFLSILTEKTDRYLDKFNECVRKILPKPKSKDKIDTIESTLEIIGKILYFCWACAPALAHQFLFRRSDDNILHGPDLTKDKHLVFAIEKEEKLMDMVRDIRQKMKGVSFSSIVFTAFSASLDHYFEKQSAESPDFVTLGLTLMMTQPQEDGSFTGSDNKFTIAFLDLPVNTGPDMIWRLEEVKRTINVIARSPDFFVNHVLMNNLTAIVPVPVMQALFVPNKQTGSMTIVPGIPEKIIAAGYKLQDLIFHPPQRGKAGIGLSVLTYDKRFQLGLIVDRAIIPDVRDAQLIVDDVLIQLQKLHDAVLQLKTT